MNGKWIDQFPPEREYDLEIDEDTYELQMADTEIAQAAADRAEAAAAIAVEKATDISNQVNQATEGARVATQKATEAGNYANGAEVSARVAVQNKNEAEQAKNLAITAKNDTQAIKEEVEQIIEGIDEAGAAANASAQAAANSATSASGSASQAAQAKIDAQTARDEAIEAAQNAQAAADTALDTQNMIATVETTEIASKDYAVDDLLIYEGVLYKVSDIITLGDTLIPNSNIEETTVKESINNAVPSWAKASTKPSYTASEVGAPTVQEMNTAIGTAISNINSFDMAVVQTLPSENISTHTIYLVPKTGETNDVYDEYIYVNNNWEMIGNTQIDLSGYATKSEIPDTSIYVTKESIDNAGIKSRTYSPKFGGAFSVTTAASADYIKPHARASVTGRFDKTELHRVMVNGTEYVLRTRLWYKGNKVYEYLGNLALYISDVSGVPGGTDNVPFVIISDLDDTDTIDVLTDVAGTYEILVEVITPSQVLLPKSLIWGDAYVPIEKANDSGTYNGFSLGVNELTSKRGTFALGYGNKISGNFGVAIGTDNTISNTYGIAVGAGNTVSGQDGHAEGFENNATGKMSHAEGQRSEASGIISHAEGNYTVASGNCAHTEGQHTIASANMAHAEGNYTVASGSSAHAEGDRTEASGSRSHAEGSYTVANHFAQHVSGQYNVPDPSAAEATERGKYVEIIGNGTADDARSNARTLDWDGNERLAGDLTIHAGGAGETTVGEALAELPVLTEDVNSLKNTVQNHSINLFDGTPLIDYAVRDLDYTGIPGKSDSTCLAVKRRGSRIVLNGGNIDNASKTNVFVKLTGNTTGRTINSSTVRTWADGITLKTGRTYKATVAYVSGESSSANDPPVVTVSVYNLGTAGTIGYAAKDGNGRFIRYFTVTGELNLALFVPCYQITYTDYTVDVILEEVEEIVGEYLPSMVTNRALAVNDFVIVGNELFRISAPVTSGGTLIPGTNCEKVTITETLSAQIEEANALKNDLNATQAMLATVEADSTASKEYAIGDLLVFEGKLYQAVSAISLGGTLIPNGNIELTTVEQQLASSGGGDVDDVQINGASVVSDGVANVPVATSDNFGVIKYNREAGTNVDSLGRLNVWSADNAQIKSGSNTSIPIAAGKQHLAIFYGLAKVAGSDEKNSTLPAGQYTENAKSAIHEMLNGSVEVTGTTPTIAAKSGISYKCGEVSTLDITLPASGCIDVIFESGSTPTVLTVTPPTGVTLRWANGFDPNNLEANTMYEINILDGLGVAMTWT